MLAGVELLDDPESELLLLDDEAGVDELSDEPDEPDEEPDEEPDPDEDEPLLARLSVL